VNVSPIPVCLFTSCQDIPCEPEEKEEQKEDCWELAWGAGGATNADPELE